MSIDRTKWLDAAEALRLRTVAEAWAVLDLAAGRTRGPVVWAVVDTALLTGLRVSELARLTVGDLDAKRGALRVWRHKRRPRAQETLALPPELVEHLGRFVAWKLSAGQAVDPGAALFVGKRGPLTAQGLAQLWKVAVKRAGLPRELSIHCARHTLAVALLGATHNLRQVQVQLGHRSPVVTANLYAAIPFDEMKKGLEGLYEKP
ncbi:MAG TPA: tyrosine-type recombinase/integrase [Phycisphaerae bacterium]|nr:tyrosine-type recombinase/integrase [Phycisphaerae bacterium]